AVNSIADNGYLLSEGRRFAHGRAIYSTPEITIAERYATECNHNGSRYKFVFQNRVNPVNLKKINNVSYWLAPSESDIRPYGLCVKVIN
ncbi:hypothetical protein C1645_760742, partial [Glomus cerebriforme]